MPRTQDKSRVSNVPKGWPDGVAYTPKPVYSAKLTKELHHRLLRAKNKNDDTVEVEQGPSALVRITPIIDASHPAHGQNGLFAAQHLPPDTRIISYIGYYHSSSDVNSTSDYDLSLDRELGIAVDAAKMGNEARFINDYRGTSASGPNAEFREVWANIGSNQVEKRIAVYVLSAGKSGKRAKGIAKGQEILVSYGKGFWTERQRENSVPDSEPSV